MLPAQQSQPVLIPNIANKHELLSQLLHLGYQYLILIDSAVSHLLQIIQSYTSIKTLKYYSK